MIESPGPDGFGSVAEANILTVFFGLGQVVGLTNVFFGARKLGIRTQEGRVRSKYPINVLHKRISGVNSYFKKEAGEKMTKCISK